MRSPARAASKSLLRKRNSSAVSPEITLAKAAMSTSDRVFLSSNPTERHNAEFKRLYRPSGLTAVQVSQELGVTDFIVRSWL
jgi:hypothetical protein